MKFRALDHKADSLTGSLLHLLSLHLIKIDPPASAVGVVVSHGKRQHLLECMRMQVSHTISLSTSEYQQDFDPMQFCTPNLENWIALGVEEVISDCVKLF
jgi:hypothetical protein